MSDAIREALAAAAACVGCGACMGVCPVYRAGRREDLVARGKLRVLAALGQGLSPDREALELLGRCLLCGRCQANCPNLVPAREGLLAGRRALAEAVGAPLVKRLLLTRALPRPERLDALARAGRLAVPALSGLHLRLAGDLEPPQPASRFFLDDAPRVVHGPKGAPRLGLFVGCVANYLRPSLARRAVELLSRRYTVVIPKAQGCCGLPAMAAGLAEPAQDLARRHAEIFGAARIDRLVTTCGSCAYALAKEAPALVPTPGARELAAKVVEISQVLAEAPELVRGLAAGGPPVALHHPCHLSVDLKVTAEPAAVLAAAGAELAPMEGADQCCGGGGLFMVAEPELSRGIMGPRLEAFRQSGAGVLATSCSGCRLQWSRGLTGGAPVVHPIELITPR